ncbi:hypothetical protein BH23ACT10_BH23ACT10_26620 [soil metagenome]
MEQVSDERSLAVGPIGNGLPLVAVIGASLVFAGSLAIYVAVSGQLLPHHLAFLGMTADQIGDIADGRLLAHRAPASVVTLAYVEGVEITALCGVRFTPHRNPDHVEECSACAEGGPSPGRDGRTPRGVDQPMPAARAARSRRRSSAVAAASRASTRMRPRSRRIVMTVPESIRSEFPTVKLGTRPSMHSRRR